MPTFQFTNNETGENFDVDFDTEPTEADFQHVQSQLDSQPLEDSGQSRAASMGAGFTQALSKVATGTVEGLGQLSGSLVRNANPVGWAAHAGVPGAQEVVDAYSSIPESLARGAGEAQEYIEEQVPTNPLYADTWGQKGAGVTGQVVGQLGTMLTGAAITKVPRIIQALGLGQAGLLGVESGYAEADRLGITEPWQRDALAASYGAAEAGVEGMGGFGSAGFAKALTGQIRDVIGAGAVKRFGKTALIEGIEEPITGTLQAGASNVLADEDPANPGFTVNGQPLPSVDPTTGEFWKNRSEEFALGVYGGALFGGAQVAMSAPRAQKARKLQQKTDLTIALYEDKPDKSEQEVAELEELKALKPVLDAAVLQSQPAPNLAVQATRAAIGSAQAAGLPQTASVLEELANLDATLEGVEETFVAPEEEVVVEETPREFNLADFNPADQIAEGSESTVYRQGDRVIKVGEAYNDPASFEPRVADILRGDREIGSGNLKLDGYYTSPNGVKNPIFSQPFIDGRAATQEEIKAHMASKGYAYVPARRMYVKQTPEGLLAASDLDGDNVKVTPNGQIEVIDATVFEPSVSPELYAVSASQTDPAASLAPAAVQSPSAPQNEPQATSGPKDTLVANARAVVDSQKGKLPSAADAWVGTREQLLADPEVRQAFVQNEMRTDSDLTEEAASTMFDRFMSNPRMDGVTFGGRTYILADSVTPTKKDRTFEGAVERILRHEDTHIAIDTITEINPKFAKKWKGLKKRISADKLDDLAKRRYPALSNWRQSDEALNNLAHEYFAEQMEREEAGLAVDDRDLLQQFIDFIRDVMARVTGREVTIEEIREFVKAGRVARAQMLEQTQGGTRASQQSAVPAMPAGEPAFTDWIPVVDKARALELAWTPFAVAWQEENPQGTTEDLYAAWAAEIANPESPAIAQGQTEAFMESRQRPEGPAVYSPEPSQSAPETLPARASMQPVDPIQRLKDINEAFAYETVAGQQPGLDPTNATTKERTFAADGTPVDFSRAGMTNVQQQGLASEAIDLLSSLSPDGRSKTFGKDLMAYLSGAKRDIYGQQFHEDARMAILNHLDGAVQDRAQVGIDGTELRRVRSQALSRAGATLQQAASSIYTPLRDIAERAEKATDKAMAEEGVDPVKMATEIKAEVTAAQTELVKDVTLPEVKATILEGAQNDADELYELGLSGLDPKFVAMIRERDERIVRIGQLRRLEAMLSEGPRGAKASLAPLPNNMTLDEVRAMIAQEEAEVQKLTSNIEAASKKEKRKAREAKGKETEDNATFTDWVMGGASAGIDSFDDLMLKYIDPNGFNREAFTTLLTNSFQQADPNLIMGVVNRVADLMDGAATEEGLAEDAAKAPNYDARAKRIVGTEIAKGSTPEAVKAAQNPLTALITQRLKGEVSVENFNKAAADLGIEPETTFALLQKVDQDRARMGDAKAQRELNAQAKKDMAAFRRASHRHEREAQAKITSLANQFTDTPTFTKAKAISELKALSDSFLGKNGPPISKELFMERATALNLSEGTATNLRKLLSESRRREIAVVYAKMVQKAAEAKQRAIESAVKKLKGKTGNQTKLRQRSTFVNNIMGALEGGILESDAIRAAFAEAYELHGLTPEVLKDLGNRLQEINAMKEGMVKETLLLQFNAALNEVAPTASFSNYSYTSLMGYILGGVTTLAMQTTGLNRLINPLAGTVETLFSLPGTTAQKIGRTINPVNLMRVYLDGLAETWSNVPQTLAGASGLINSQGYGVGMQPSSLAAVKPREMSMSYVPWGQISKYRFNTPKLLKAMGLEKAFQATKFSSWMASRSFQAIRGAEGWVGGTDKNTQFKRVAVESLMKQGKTFDEAWNMVQEALGPKNAEVWENASKQADKEIADGLVSKFSKKQRQTEIAQDFIDEQWNLDLKNRYREQAALAGYKQDPISPLGAWMYRQMSSVINNDSNVMSNLKFSFLFARFFSNAIEGAYFRTPIAGLMALGIKEPTGELDERQQRIVQIFGSMDNYRDVRLGRAASGTAILGSLGALMIYSLLNWDPDDDEPPGPIWMTGDPVGEFGRKAIMESNSWWRPNTLYLFGRPVVNFVNASPEYAMVGAFAGNVGDRFMFDQLLNMKKDKATDEYVRSNFQSFVAPFRDTTLAPWSRSTYNQWFGAAEALFDGDPKKFAKLFANPFTGTAASLTIGAIPSVKTLEKVERMQYQPKAPKDTIQAMASSVPFANTLGLDMGQPMVTPFGEETTGYPFLSIFVNPQEVTETTRKAANTLAQLGITKLGVKERYIGDGTAEVFHNGKRYLLSQQQRGRVLRQIGQKFATMINANTEKLRKLERTKGRDAASDEIDNYAKKARSEVLFNLRPQNG